MMTVYHNVHEAIRDGNARGPCGVAYYAARGWVLYDLTVGPPEGSEPELICLRSGVLPLPVSEAGRAIFKQLVEKMADA